MIKMFEKKCACGGYILGPREGGKARGRWLGFDQCRHCRIDDLSETMPRGGC